MGVAHPGPSRAAPRSGHRDHHRPPGPGPGHRGGPGRRRGPPARRVRSRPGGPPHLRLRRRRLLHGGRLIGGGVAGRAPGPGPSHRAVRRQSHLHRGPDEPGLHRGCGRPLRRLRVADAGGGRARPRRGGRRGERCPGRRVPALSHLLPHPHRLRGAHQAGLGRLSRVSAGGGGDRRGQAGHGLAGGPPLRGGPRGLRLLRRGHVPGGGGPPRLGGAPRPPLRRRPGGGRPLAAVLGAGPGRGGAGAGLRGGEVHCHPRRPPAR